MADASDNRTQRVRIALLIAAAVLTGLSCIDAPTCSRGGIALYLQHLGTLFLLLPLAADLKLRTFTIPDCVCLFLFICLHILGARYLYSYVPYREWAQRLFDWHIPKPEIHGNQFDRLVHFAFGVLILPVFLRIARRRLKIGNYAVALLVAWLFVQCAGMLYEIFEWLLTKILKPEDVRNYNGQQNDIWDAQKDMCLALIGSTVSAAFLALRRRFVRRTERREK